MKMSSYKESMDVFMVFVNYFIAIATQQNPRDCRIKCFLDGPFTKDRAPRRI